MTVHMDLIRLLDHMRNPGAKRWYDADHHCASFPLIEAVAQLWRAGRYVMDGASLLL